MERDYLRTQKQGYITTYEKSLADAPGWALQIVLVTIYMLYVVIVAVRTVLALLRAHRRARAAARGVGAHA